MWAVVPFMRSLKWLRNVDLPQISARSEVHHCLSEEYLPEGLSANVLEAYRGAKGVFGTDECAH